jgi:hypothetical protein
VDRRGIKYLVSGDPTLGASAENLRRAGKDPLKHGSAVPSMAHEEILAGQCCVVVAHGEKNGTLYWHNGSEAIRWLWRGMELHPKGARIHLYSCHVGPDLAAELSECEVVGHEDRVPVPDGGCRLTVEWFLEHVDKLLSRDPFDAAGIRSELLRLVRERQPNLTEVDLQEEEMHGVHALLLLRRSLGDTP